MRDSFFKLMTAFTKPATPVDRTEVEGLIVSTVDTPDCGLETAIVDANGSYPVEHYATLKGALAGHKRWCEKAKTLETVIELGYGDDIAPMLVRLVRASSDV